MCIYMWICKYMFANLIYVYTAIYHISRLYNCKLSRKPFILNYIFSQLIYIHKHMYVCVYILTHIRTHTRTIAGRRPLATGRHWQLATATGDWLHILNFAVARSWLFVNWFQCLPTALAAPATDATAVRCPLCAATTVDVDIAAASVVIHFVVCRLSFAVHTQFAVYCRRSSSLLLPPPPFVLARLSHLNCSSSAAAGAVTTRRCPWTVPRPQPITATYLPRQQSRPRPLAELALELN